MEQALQQLVTEIVKHDELHAKWLNSLSMMENTGARKISRYEHPVQVGMIVLKHAAEEARHAYYLKKQIEKLQIVSPNYSFEYLLAPVESHHYLHQLDAQVSKYIKTKLGLSGRELKHAAYLLVTYAIEVRADMLYAIYQQALTASRSKVNVKSIIAEEEGHLAEMERMLQELATNWKDYADEVCIIEVRLFGEWIQALQNQVFQKKPQAVV